MVQAELKKRSESKVKKIGDSIFSGMVFCKDCGSVYTSKVWHSNDKYRRIIWQCINKFSKDKEKCSTPHFTEEQLKDIFIQAFNEVFDNKDEVLSNLQMGIDVITDTAEIDKQCTELESELEVVTELLRNHIADNAIQAIDQEVYQQGYDRLASRYDGVKSRLKQLSEQREQRKAKRIEIDKFMATLRQQERFIDDFDEELFAISVERIVVCGNGGVRVVFRDGQCIRK
jgi:DNA mismatch repair ATPase MutS